jgi:hypothetical protein
MLKSPQAIGRKQLSLPGIGFLCVLDARSGTGREVRDSPALGTLTNGALRLRLALIATVLIAGLTFSDSTAKTLGTEFVLITRAI